MSTAKKRTIKYSAFAAALILIVAYFSLLSPTSAYFYKTQSSTTSITFATFDVEQTLFENENVLKFKGATKLCDFDEKLFDEVAIVKEVTLTNSGEAPARIIVNITPDEESVTKGLRYVAFIEKLENAPETVAEGEDETTTSTKVEKGAIKTELETLFGIDENSTHDDIEAKLNEYNNEFKSKYVTLAPPDKDTLAPGESAKVRIIFWVEYDLAQAAAGGESKWQNAGGIANIEYPCNIRIIAVQDNDAAVTAALTTKPTEENSETTVEEASNTEATTEQQ